MPLPELSPYDVLGLAPTAGVREINVSVGTAMKAGRYPRQQIQEAAALLRNPNQRLELDLQQPLPAAPPSGVLELLAPTVAEPLLVIDRPALPAASALLTLRRDELTADFVEPPVPDRPAPAIPARFGAGLSALPMIELPE